MLLFYYCSLFNCVANDEINYSIRPLKTWQSSSKKKLSKREERRERDRLLRREMRKDVTSLQLLIKRMEHKQLLTAIVFIF